jgi:hypothetical protein
MSATWIRWPVRGIEGSGVVVAIRSHADAIEKVQVVSGARRIVPSELWGLLGARDGLPGDGLVAAQPAKFKYLDNRAVPTLAISFLKERGRSRPRPLLICFYFGFPSPCLCAPKEASGSRLGRSPTA